MAIGVYFHPESMSSAQYDEIIKELEAAGAGSPKGRVHHSAFGSPDGLSVYDVWTSQEEFDEFGKTLVPVLQKLGLDAGAPDVVPVHNLIQ